METGDAIGASVDRNSRNVPLEFSFCRRQGGNSVASCSTATNYRWWYESHKSPLRERPFVKERDADKFSFIYGFVLEFMALNETPKIRSSKSQICTISSLKNYFILWSFYGL